MTEARRSNGPVSDLCRSLLSLKNAPHEMYATLARAPVSRPCRRDCGRDVLDSGQPGSCIWSPPSRTARSSWASLDPSWERRLQVVDGGHMHLPTVRVRRASPGEVRSSPDQREDGVGEGGHSTDSPQSLPDKCPPIPHVSHEDSLASAVHRLGDVVRRATNRDEFPR